MIFWLTNLLVTSNFSNYKISTIKWRYLC